MYMNKGGETMGSPTGNYFGSRFIIAQRKQNCVLLTRLRICSFKSLFSFFTAVIPEIYRSIWSFFVLKEVSEMAANSG